VISLPKHPIGEKKDTDSESNREALEGSSGIEERTYLLRWASFFIGGGTPWGEMERGMRRFLSLNETSPSPGSARREKSNVMLEN